MALRLWPGPPEGAREHRRTGGEGLGLGGLQETPPVTDHRGQVPVRRCGEQGENDAETSNVEATGSERWGFGGVVLGGRGHQQRKGRMTVELTRKKVPVS